MKRNGLPQQLRGIDVDEVRRRGIRYARGAKNGAGQGALWTAEQAYRSLEKRMRPGSRPKRRFPLIGIAGAAVAAAGAVAFYLYDRERRGAVTGRAVKLQEGARQRYADLGGVGGAVGKVRSRVGTNAPRIDEAALEEQIRKVIAKSGKPVSEVKVSVEGRTVYLRGVVEDPKAVDSAAERIHGVDGVVAVVNLTTSPARAGDGNTKKTSAS